MLVHIKMGSWSTVDSQLASAFLFFPAIVSDCPLLLILHFTVTCLVWVELWFMDSLIYLLSHRIPLPSPYFQSWPENQTCSSKHAHRASPSYAGSAAGRFNPVLTDTSLLWLSRQAVESNLFSKFSIISGKRGISDSKFIWQGSQDDDSLWVLIIHRKAF